MHYVFRIFLTLAIFFVWHVLTVILNTPITLETAQLAGEQFKNSDAAYVHTTLGLSIAALANVFLFVSFVGLLVLTWWEVGKRILTALFAGAMFFLVITPHVAHAYYDKTNYTEPYFILPNESAFFIPDVGANKDSQTAFGSIEYLNANKIPAKRFEIPHGQLSGSSWYANYYVPTGRLIIIDRTPFNREWVSASHRGTSDKDESFRCQTSEGLDFFTGVSIAAFVTETDAAKFLYWFGVNPPKGDRTDPQVIFTSVFYGKSLTQVMDGPVRSNVQALVCNEVMQRDMQTANREMTKMMANIQVTVRAYLESRGITLDYIGWADTVGFGENGKVQDAIDRKFVAARDAEIADQLAGKTGTIQAMASAEATRTIAGKWNGTLPNNVSLWWLPQSIADWIANIGAKK